MYNPDNVDDYSKKQLAEMIFNGEVSREQVDEDGLFRKHRPLLDEELSLMTQEELDWTEATTKNTVGSYQVYLEKYNPTIVEGETVTDGWVENTVYVGRHVEDARRLQTAVKQLDADEKENEKDKAAWVKAKNADNIECYIEYISTFDRQPPLYRGQYVDEAKLRINKLQDVLDWEKAKSLDTIDSYKSYLDKYGSSTSSYQGAYISDAKRRIAHIISETDDREWKKACKADTITAYRLYLSKFGSGNSAQKGKHIEDAKVRINNLMDDACWADTVKQNTQEAYRDYLQKYPTGAHVAEAHKRLRPPVPPKPIFKYILVLFMSTACVFFSWQYLHKKWPFEDEKHKSVMDTVKVVLPTQDSKPESGSEKLQVDTDSVSQDTAEKNKKEVDSTKTTTPPTTSGRSDKSSNRTVPSAKKQKKVPFSIKDYEELAKSGDTSAYAVLAKKYLNKNNYDKAAYWANKAWKANVNRSLAKEVIEHLSDIDYYVGAKYKKPY